MRTARPAASGALLLGQADARIGPVDRLAACFEYRRDGRFVEHSVRTLVGQRAFGIALDDEDLLDRDALRGAPVMATLAGKLRAKYRNCAPVAGKSTSSRLELGDLSPSGDSKIVHDGSAIADVSGTLFLDVHGEAPERAVPGFDATDDPVHGSQKGWFFHGYYDGYCYLPLDVLCSRRLLASRLRPVNIDGAAGAVEEAARLVALLRAQWPATRIVLRADRGSRARNLWRGAKPTTSIPCSIWRGASVRRRRVRTRWRRPRRTVGRAARRRGASRTSCGPRATVGPRTPRRRQGRMDLWQGQSALRHRLARRQRACARSLDKDLSCQRGEMETRIEECQLDLFADRTSAHCIRANQLCLWFASMAYALLCALRACLGLAHTRLAAATRGSLRLEPLKIAAWVRIGVRRIERAMDTNHPFQDEFHTARRRLPAAAA